MKKPYRPVPHEELLSTFSQMRQKEIKEGGERLVFGYQMRRYRESLTLTQSEVAKRMGVSQEAVSRFELGQDAKMSTVTKYVQALGGTFEWQVTNLPSNLAEDGTTISC
jgi:DNA-binding XRE family transcriptional regulator